MPGKPYFRRLWLAVLLGACVAVYASGVHIPYYADDYHFAFDQSAPRAYHYYFAHNIPENNFYRPVQAAFLLAVQRHFGLNAAPVHVVQLALHVLLCWLVFASMLRLGFSEIQAGLGSLFMAVSQANAAAVLNNDTLSQVAGTLFGCLACLFAYLHASGSRTGRPVRAWYRSGHYWLCLLSLVIAYLSKETSVSFLIMVLAIIALGLRRGGGGSLAVLRKSLPIVLATVLYVAARALVAKAQPAFGPERYGFHFGTNVVRNLAMLAFASAIPLSSVAAFTAAKTRALAEAIAMLGATSVFLLIVLWGLRIDRRRRGTSALLGAFALAAFFPVVLLNRVSELYAYNAMPFVSVLVGAGLGALLEGGVGRRAARAFVAAATLLAFASHSAAVRGKAGLMRAAGERENAILAQMESHIARVPENGKLLLINPREDTVEYSIYVFRGFNVLKDGLHWVKQRYGRPDIEIVIVDALDEASEGCLREGRCLALALERGAVREYGRGGAR